MGYQASRDYFLTSFTRMFPEAPHGTALALLRAATSEQRYNEIATSIDVGAVELARLEKRSDARRERIAVLCNEIGADLEENGDPRGCPFRICFWTGIWLGVPGKGLPARCFR